MPMQQPTQKTLSFVFFGLACMSILTNFYFKPTKSLPGVLRTIMSSSESKSRSFPPLLSISIDDAAEGLQAGRFTSVELVKAYLARIEEASEFRAVLQVNSDVLQAAQSLDEERQRSTSRGPLHGIPILVKDNIVTNDPLEASSGSLALLGAKPAVESSLITRLRDAGALILGKSNPGEWGNFRGWSIPSGWSPRGGQTTSAYYPHGDPEGSSSGSAVAVSLGLCMAALGTETAGSIIDPAELNNVVGFKPSRGIIATDGTIPISTRQDVIGTLTRTVKDAAYMLSAMAGRSERDERTWNIPPGTVIDYTASCQSTDLNGIAVGVPRNAFVSDIQPPVMSAFESALDRLRDAGASVVDNTNFSAADEFERFDPDLKSSLRSADFKQDIAAYLKTLKLNPHNLQSADDIIEFTKSHQSEEYPSKDIDNFLAAQAEKIEVGSEQYKKLVEKEQFFGSEGGIVGALDKHGLDVLVVPTTLGTANEMAARMSFPVMTVPLGFWPEGTPIQRGNGDLVSRAPGIPFCLTVMTKAYSETKLLQVAYALEQLTSVRQNGPLPIKVLSTELTDVRPTLQKI